MFLVKAVCSDDDFSVGLQNAVVYIERVGQVCGVTCVLSGHRWSCWHQNSIMYIYCISLLFSCTNAFSPHCIFCFEVCVDNRLHYVLQL